jgi:hypothetical protein
MKLWPDSKEPSSTKCKIIGKKAFFFKKPENSVLLRPRPCPFPCFRNKIGTSIQEHLLLKIENASRD